MTTVESRSGTASSGRTPVHGRFAPSPTGPLHFGSLVAALASYLHARHYGGRWSVRIEDLDPPREVPGAADGILRRLEQLGFEWDGPVVHQSRRADAYREALTALRRLDAVFDCACSRREIAEIARPGAEGPIYPGTCRNGLPPGRQARAVRLRAPVRTIHFRDRAQGPRRQNLATEVGDFVVRRADGLFSYQLAVVVDDAWQGITQVVRGADLITSTPRQIFLQDLLGLPHPEYLHAPVVLDSAGHKLSKSSRAPSLAGLSPAELLCRALRVLGQPVPEGGTALDPASVLAHAVPAWNPGRVPRRLQVPLTGSLPGS